MIQAAIPSIDLGAELGRGAQSVVLRGTRDGRAYAVKLPLQNRTPADRNVAYRRFLREAVALARTHHPSLPAVMEVGRADELPYLVMELASGQTLAERLTEGPLTQKETAVLARQLAGALEAIHAAGLVHRDIKPSNIVFDLRTGVARLIDLGSAAFAYDTTELVGTRAYAAPEMLGRDFRAIDGRADLYSLGIVLLEALGEAPRPQLSDGPPSRWNALARSSIAPEFAAILEHLVAIDVDRRYEDAASLRDDLDRLPSEVGGAVVLPPRPASPAKRLFGRKPELERLRRLWADAQRSGKVVVLEGLPGIGKTRLAKSFVEEVSHAGGRVLTAACHPREARAFSAVRQLVDGFLRDTEALPSEERTRALAAVRQLAGSFGAILKPLSPALARVFHDAPSVPASENAEQAFAEALVEFVGRLFRSFGPLLVFVDDVQWLDPSSRRVLARVANRAPGIKVLLLFGMRSSEAVVEAAHFFEGISSPTTRMELGPLTDDQIVDLAREYLAARELEPEVKKAILRLSDGIPFRAFEVLRTLTEEGVLLPRWGRWELDSSALTEMHLPGETASLLRRRIANLDESVLSVLRVAAVIGATFEEELLRSVVHPAATDVEQALAGARQAQLIEPLGGGHHRFIHQTIRDALLAACDASLVADIHQRVAVGLDSFAGRAGFELDVASNVQPSPDVPGDRRKAAPIDADPIYRLATHYAAGLETSTPRRLAETNVQAGRTAVARFDNERAIVFFGSAERGLVRLGSQLDSSDRLLLAEAKLRTGALDDAVREFEGILSGPSTTLVRAAALGRIAFVCDIRLDSDSAWRALERAFAELGEELPRESLGYSVRSVAGWLGRRPIQKVRAIESTAGERARDEMLCSLYYQASRIAYSSAKPGRVILATLRSLGPAERLGPSAALAKSYVTYAFALTVLGFEKTGARYLAVAEEIGQKLHDPVAYSHALQVHHVVAAASGRVQDAIDACVRCIDEFGYWRELNDFGTVCYAAYELESMRGRELDAWTWLGRVLDRINQHEGAPVVPEYLLCGARAALTAQGRQGEIKALLTRLERATVAVPKGSGAYPITFSPRVKVFTERMDLGPELEAVITEFRGLGQDPKRVHLMALEYYIHVAHARVHACLRSELQVRAALLPELKRASDDLAAAARKIPLFVAHAVVIHGYEHLFHGRHDDALASFSEAERLGIQENAPWVLYSVHRGRAHLLRTQGKENAAIDQAVLAESVVREHGSVYRARWIREEFGLRLRFGRTDSSRLLSGSFEMSSQDESVSTILGGGSRARRQLRALLRISRARAQELDPDHQARLVVDELVQALRARRGLLYLTAELARPPDDETPDAASASGEIELVAGRDATGRNLGDAGDYDRAAIRAASLIGDVSDDDAAPMRAHISTTARLSVIAAPLVVDDVTAGVVYLDRPLGDGLFTDADGEVLTALAGQVSVALELTRALRARERAQESLRNVEKMDAVARFARGIAHDLNNMLSAIRMATVAMIQTPTATEIVGEDIRTIESALQRANELTRQLGAFSRGEFGKRQLVRLNSRIERLIPVISGLVGENIRVEHHLAPRIAQILVDPDQIDQVFMNLVVNARDAIEGAGQIVIETEEVQLDQVYAREHPRVQPGRYVRLALTDSGHGMTEDVIQKIFEPYFTTKKERGGSGLGLASAYWIVSRSGGHIDVRSKVGEGTTFSLYFPCAEKSESMSPRYSLKPHASHSDRATVLLVEEDPVTVRHFEQTLVERGYRVLSARSASQALDLARQRIQDIDLAITDVSMTGMNGLELVRELRRMKVDLRVLYIGNEGGTAQATSVDGRLTLSRQAAGDTVAERVRAAFEGIQRVPLQG